MRDISSLLTRLRGDEPLVRLGDIRADGVVRVIARIAAGGATVVSPFSGECAHCIRIQCHRRSKAEVASAAGNAALESIWDETFGEPFDIADESGCATVHPVGADVIAASTDVSRLVNVGATQDALRFLYERRLKVGLIVEQSLLREGMFVEVSGRVALEPGDAAAYRSPAPRGLAFSSDASHGVTLRIRALA